MTHFESITGEVLRKRFLDPSDRILRYKKHALPSDQAFEGLAIAINGHRRRFLSKNKLELQNRINKFEKAAEAASVLSAFIADMPACSFSPFEIIRDPPEGLFDLYIKDEKLYTLTFKRDLDKVDRAFKRALAEVPTMNPIVQHWHDYVVDLEQTFTMAMKSTNPNITISRSKTGALARFLKAVIPLISGEHPGLDATVQQLERSHPKVRKMKLASLNYSSFFGMGILFG